MNRLREAREYLGFTISEVCGATGFDRDTIHGFERERLPVNDAQFAAFSRLYQRPIDWLKGEPEEPLTIPPALLDGPGPRRSGLKKIKAANLSERDTLELARFAQFLVQRAKSKDTPPHA